MALLIDGYNLLHATGIVGRGPGPGSLERSRRGLLNFLVASIDPAELPQSAIIFDANDVPPGLPDTVDHDGLTVHFARGYPDADAMLEALIARHHAPRSLTVVSSDHRVQRAARRRKAVAVDSDQWYAELHKARRRRTGREPGSPAKPDVELDPEEVDYWTKKFAVRPADLADATTTPEAPVQDEQSDEEFLNPFPPGYGEDLLDEKEGG